MKFTVTGANKETGEDVNMTVHAIDSKAAEQIAHEQNVMIAAITAVPDQVDLSPLAMDPELDPFTSPAPAAAAGTHGNGDPAAHAEAAPEAHHDPEQHVPHHPDAHMEYKLLQNQALFLLEKTVSRFLADGWEPVGGLTVAVINNAPNYFQALIRRHERS